MKKYGKLMALAAACAMLLSGCGGIATAGTDPEPAPALDNMLPSDRWDSAGSGQGSGTGTGYELDVDANTAVLDSLMASYDSSTRVTMDASAELGAMHDDGAAQESPEEGGTGTVPEQEPQGGDPAGMDPPDAPASDEIVQEPVPIAPAPLPTVLSPVASGVSVMSNSNCAVDYSNIQDGYFMARWLASPQKIKLQSTGPSGVTYTYDLQGNSWSAFPLSDGNGNYDIRVMQNVGGTKYAVAGTVSFQASLTDEFAPFLRPNQYVNYESAPDTMAQASECCRGISGELDKVAAVYDWVVANLSYDRNKAQTVQSGYLPDLDSVYAAKSGICFDYAAMMAAMLRSQSVPCRLVVGYAGSAYHAWISVHVAGQGWVDGVIFFDGSSWQRMDPTFASSGNGSAEIMKYIGDGSNYSARYLY